MFITVTGQAEGRHSTLASIAVAGRTGSQRESRTRSSGWLAGATWGVEGWLRRAGVWSSVEGERERGECGGCER